ncbi:DNA gyrase inhibitor YacG [Frigidibacter sp. ROC022]|uniref:DNA gyrase inhibitor YacG n=1 Tax=Frigidibacter sp. ROC022 TaxID=2971796 RepID=UPI00215AF7D9|nr:DNA gyrase inhibitor YacG [Frigidibacter sp. ROC022]MCR8725074.1 DNA gyrase inhibitor YacG [Frigidibacter sp. ROC022]
MTTAATLCPICGRPTIEDYRPFCSRRCADVDLRHWLTGSYAIPAVEDDDPDEEDEVDPRRRLN